MKSFLKIHKIYSKQGTNHRKVDVSRQTTCALGIWDHEAIDPSEAERNGYLELDDISQIPDLMMG